MSPKLAKYNKCTGCSACAEICPQNAICIDYDKNGFLHPKINLKACINCGACERVCPILHINKLPFHNIINSNHFAAWSNNDEICKNSTSGGIFTQIATNFLQNDSAIIFGAESLKNNTCHQSAVNNINELSKIQGTKYIQSEIYGSFRNVRKALKENKIVLYCGTPCQIAGLYAFLGYKDHNNLYTAELICHGVGGKITADIATKYAKADSIYSYRDKEKGWCINNEHVCLRTTFQKNNILFTTKNNYFWNALETTHRISCTICPFAQPNRIADITLGDLWGLYHKYKERSQLGASLVLVNSEKGHRMIKSGNIIYHKHELKELNCYTLFYPGTCKYTQLSNLLFLIKKLPNSIAYNIISLNWKKNVFLIPIKAYFKFINNKHHENIINAIKNKKSKLGLN